MSPGSSSAARPSATCSVVLDGMPSRNEREPVVGAGKGGDDTTAVDAAAEAAILERLERLHADEDRLPPRLRGSSASARTGCRRRRTSWSTRSTAPLNAKRNIPFFSVSIAVAEGPTMKDVVFGFVHDFGTRRGVDCDQRRRCAG